MRSGRITRSSTKVGHGHSNNRELIARFEKKIQPTLADVWGEDIEGDSK